MGKRPIVWTECQWASPKSITIEAVKNAGYEEMPKYGFIPVTVPGTPGAWAALSERFGRLPLKEVLKPLLNMLNMDILYRQL